MSRQYYLTICAIIFQHTGRIRFYAFEICIYIYIVILFLCRFLINIIKLCKPMSKLDLSALRKRSRGRRNSMEQIQNLTLARIRTKDFCLSRRRSTDRATVSAGSSRILILLSLKSSTQIRELPADTVAQMVESLRYKRKTWLRILASVSQISYLFCCVLSSYATLAKRWKILFRQVFTYLIYIYI